MVRRGYPEIARSSMAQQRRAVGQVFRLEKQLAKCRMREIIGRGSEDDLGVTGDIDFADPCALIDHRHPTDVDIVFSRHGDLELRDHLVVAATKRGLVRAKRHDVLLGLLCRRMIGRRPHRPAPHVAQVDKFAARIARGVASRPRHRETAVEAAPPTGVRHD